MTAAVAVDAQTAAGQAALLALERSVKSLGAAFTRVQAQINPSKQTIAATGQAALDTANKTDRMTEAVKRSQKANKELTGSFLNMKTAVTGFLGALAVDKLVSYSDTYTNIQNRLKLVTTGTENLTAVNKALLASANSTRSSYESTAGLYATMARATKDLGLSQQDLLGITTTLNQGFQVSGATAEDAASGIRQLGQAMTGGVLRGEEFNALNDSAPRILEALAAGMGKPRSELRKLAEEGKLTSQVVVSALQSQSSAIQDEFNKMTPTVAQSATVMKNNIIAFIGSFNQGTGVAVALSSAILLLANNLDVVAIAAAGVGVAMLAMSGPKIIAGIRQVQASLTAMSIAATANPIGIAIAAAALAVTGLVIAFNKLAPKIKVTSDGAVSLKDFFVAAFQIIGEKVAEVAKFFQDVWNGSIGGVWAEVGKFAKGFVEFIGEAVGFAVQYAANMSDAWIGSIFAITEVFRNFPAIMADIGATAVNGLIAIVEEGVNRIADVLRDGPLAAFLGGKGGGRVSLGRVDNANAGAAGRVNQRFNSARGVTEATVRGAAGAVTDRVRSNNRNRPAGAGVSSTRGTPTATNGADKDGKGGKDAADAAKKASDALADLQRQLDQVNLSEKEQAAIQALTTAGLEKKVSIVNDDIVATDAQAQAIINLSNSLFDAKKRYEDMKGAVERIATAKNALRAAELDLLAVSSPAAAAATREREAAKLAYDQTIKDIDARKLSNEQREKELRLAEAKYAMDLRVIQANENKATDDLGRDLARRGEDLALDNKAIRNPEQAERDRLMLQAERERQDAIRNLNATVIEGTAKYEEYKAKIEALYNQQVINVEETVKANKTQQLFQETNDLFVNIFQNGEAAMMEFFIKLIAQQLQAIAYAKIMGTTMQEGFNATSGGGGGGGIGSFISTFLSSAFKGGKAGGGLIGSQGIYPVGMSEARKTELMFTGSSGYLMSNRQLRQSAGAMAGASNSLKVEVNLPANYNGSPADVGYAARKAGERAMKRSGWAK
ncbi:tape measure protein [Brevundimonas sp.]|uniref:tape measure protein n=1 Tax=Brevundimonas sp. TaxID=1871086 RepID=UPI00289D8CC1|nr:tape measure protein [Brevundimonas sp.]